MPRPRTASVGGFTLLELLIATAVGAIVLLVIQTAFFGALRLHNSTNARIEEDLSVQRALGIIRRDLTGIVLPGSSTLSLSTSGARMAGQLQSTTFSASLSDSLGERVTPDIFTTSGRIDGWNPFSELQKVGYFLAAPTDGRPSEGKDLVRGVTRNLLPVQEETAEPQVLLQGVLEASIEYYDGMGWTSTWDSEVTSTLPSAFKFRLVLAGKEGDQGPSDPIELIVPVWVKTSTSAAEEIEGLGL